MTAPELVATSDALHAEVRSWALGQEHAPADFERLACSIARFQAAHIPGYARLCDARGASLDRLDQIPAVPTEAFRLTRVAVHPPELDAARFVTSGTTGAARGTHPLRRLDTYRDLALAFGARALLPLDVERAVIVALAPPPAEPPDSSLGFMMQAFMERSDGRALAVDFRGAAFDVRAHGRFLLAQGGVDVAGLRRAALVATQRREPLIVLATSFALVMLLDTLAGATVPTPKRTIVMQTGGYKGRTRSVDPEKLQQRVAKALRMDPRDVLSEYGMTELSSQCWEGRGDRAALGGTPGRYLAPPWLSVSAVDPLTLRALPHGEVGLARFVDLANVDSAVAIVTQDRVCSDGASFELLGRAPGAPPRGCSLALEALTLG